MPRPLTLLNTSSTRSGGNYKEPILHPWMKSFASIQP
jgi:hypothetical protein